MESKTETVRLHVSGMTCTGCQARIEKKLRSIPGVESADVRLRERTAVISYDPGRTGPEEFKAAVEALGYSVREQTPGKTTWRTIGLSVFIPALFALLECTGVLNLLVPARLTDSGMGFGMLFLVGLITSVHCIAMCGGINLSQCLPRTSSGPDRSSPSGVLLPALMYNLGRVISYTAAGFILGLAGMCVSGAGVAVSTPLQGLLKIAAGVFMVVSGLGMLDLFPCLRGLSACGQRLIGKLGVGKRKGRGPLVVGLLNGLMPCGPLQSMQIVALASASPLTGAASMLVFSLGTVPLMLGFGSLVSVIGKRAAKAVSSAGSVLVVVLGLSMISQGGSLSGLISFPALFAAAAALFVIGTAASLPYRKEKTKKVCTALSACLCTVTLALLCLYAPAGIGGTGADTPVTENGVQIVRSTLQPGSYPDITVRVGEPVKWMIDAARENINGCNNRIIIHEYGIEYTFREGENIIEFTPEETGSFSYSCWMGMICGNITVTK